MSEKILKHINGKDLQCVIFDREIFANRKYIKLWFEKRNLEIPNKKNPIKCFYNVFRVRLKDPNKFIKSSFEERDLNPFVCLVYGKQKK